MSEVNIKNLPEASEVNFGDFFLIENAQGTEIIKFDNFIITEKNTTFEPLLDAHTTDINFNLTRIRSLTSNVGVLSARWNENKRVASAGGHALYTLSAVGIGHANPDAKLTVTGDISASGSLSAAGGGFNYLENRLGIGTSSPSTNLHVVDTDGRIRVEATAGNHPGFELAEDSERKWIIFNRPSNDQIVFKTDTEERMVIEQSGKVGIGTTAPTTTLHVAGSGGLTIAEGVEHPLSPPAGSEGQFYIKADKLIARFNDAGTIRYKFMPLSGTGVTWTHTTDITDL